MAKFTPAILILVSVVAVAGLMAVPVANELAASQYIALDDENYEKDILALTVRDGESTEPMYTVSGYAAPIIVRDASTFEFLGTFNLNTRVFTFERMVPAYYDMDAAANVKVAGAELAAVAKAVDAPMSYGSETVLYIVSYEVFDLDNIVILKGANFMIEANCSTVDYSYAAASLAEVGQPMIVAGFTERAAAVAL